MKLPAFALFAVLAAVMPSFASAPVAPTKGIWQADGTLFESCTCAVPCSCNFGEPPSPHDYCYAVYAYRLGKASWDGVDLTGLVIAGADGPKGGAGFLDARATPAQRPALKQLARAVFAQGGAGNAPGMPFEFAAITPTVSGRDLTLSIGDQGGFQARVIVGRDGKSPVVVENNTVWPIARAIKAKSVALKFSNKAIGTITGSGTNANYGEFSFSGKSTSTVAAAKKDKSCCGNGG